MSFNLWTCDVAPSGPQPASNGLYYGVFRYAPSQIAARLGRPRAPWSQEDLRDYSDSTNASSTDSDGDQWSSDGGSLF
jgi:hypothetical protein